MTPKEKRALAYAKSIGKLRRDCERYKTALERIEVCAFQESYREPYNFIREIKRDCAKALRPNGRRATRAKET